jgi:glycosyltransferase involved in cell wall biosynthesis
VHFAGIGVVIRQLCESLRKEGHRCFLYVQIPVPPDVRMPWFDAIVVGPLAAPTRVTELGAMLQNRLACQRFSEICERWKIDLIHAHAFHRSMFTAAHTSEIPLVVTSHGDAANKRYQKQRVVNACRRIAPRVSLVTVLHAGMEACIKRNFGDLFRIAIIPNGLDDVWLQAPVVQARDLFLYAGRLVEDKRPELAILAYARSVSRKNYGLAIAGEGDLKQQLITLAKAQGLDVSENMPQQNVGNTVFFCGYQTGDVLRNLYSRSRLLLHPSNSEAFCLVLLEAMAMGVLPICDDLDTYKSQFAGSSCNVVFVENPDPEPWAKAIDAWARSPQLAEFVEVNQAGVARFAWSTVFPLYRQCYDDALAEN